MCFARTPLFCELLEPLLLRRNARDFRPLLLELALALALFPRHEERRLGSERWRRWRFGGLFVAVVVYLMLERRGRCAMRVIANAVALVRSERDALELLALSDALVRRDEQAKLVALALQAIALSLLEAEVDHGQRQHESNDTLCEHV